MLIVKDANRSLQISMDFPSRMTLLSLNHDTVERLISFLPSSDALRLSMTAHGLHQIAKRRALAEVRLRTTERSTLFCKYMLADIMDRLQHLRQLEIHLGTFYEERISLAIPGLVRVLAHAPALQSLTLDDAEVMLESGILAAAVRMLTTLEELNLRKYGLLSVSTVRRLSSNLRKLSLTGMLLPRRHVALSMLLCPDPEALTDDDQAAKRWPSITELELDVACPMDTIPHKAIVQSFPNLQCLLLRVTEADIAEGEERPTRVPDRVGWPHLDWLTGTPVSLGGFTGPVKCLRFTEGAPDVLHERGAEIVGYLRPVFLSVAAPHESDTRFWTQLGEHAHRLRSLRIELINPGKDASELDEWMVSSRLNPRIPLSCWTMRAGTRPGGALRHGPRLPGYQHR